MAPAAPPPTTPAQGRSTAERQRPAAAARLEPVRPEPPTRGRQGRRAPRFGAPPRQEPERPAVARAPMRPRRPTRGRPWAVERKLERAARPEPGRPNRLVPAPELPRAAAPMTARQAADSMKALPTPRGALPMPLPAARGRRIQARAAEHPTTGLAPPAPLPRAIPTSERHWAAGTTLDSPTSEPGQSVPAPATALWVVAAPAARPTRARWRQASPRAKRVVPTLRRRRAPRAQAPRPTPGMVELPWSERRSRAGPASAEPTSRPRPRSGSPGPRAERVARPSCSGGGAASADKGCRRSAPPGRELRLRTTFAWSCGGASLLA